MCARTRTPSAAYLLVGDRSEQRSPSFWVDVFARDGSVHVCTSFHQELHDLHVPFHRSNHQGSTKRRHALRRARPRVQQAPHTAASVQSSSPNCHEQLHGSAVHFGDVSHDRTQVSGERVCGGGSCLGQGPDQESGWVVRVSAGVPPLEASNCVGRGAETCSRDGGSLNHA